VACGFLWEVHVGGTHPGGEIF